MFCDHGNVSAAIEKENIIHYFGFYYVLWFEMYLACYPPLSHTGPTCRPGTSSGADQPEPRPHRRYSGQKDPEH